VGYFRGTDTGCTELSRPIDCQRVKLALLSKEFPEAIDAAITAVQGDDEELRSLYRDLGIYKESREPQEKVLAYKYQIDVDGNSNAWAGLFIKLLSESVVLKVESSKGFRQWFYSRLEPWVNYVPVKSDLSDLVDKVEYLKKNDSHARQIAKNGKDLALSIDYKSSIEYGALILYTAFIGLDIFKDNK
jgi:hypothetical protein